MIATLFGPAKDGVTCACDAAKDGVTNPSPINGNSAASFTADDDGGFFAQQARAYRRGPLPLSGGSTASTGAPLATLRGRIGWGYVFRGGFQKIDASVRANRVAKVGLRATPLVSSS
ncbi:MAG: hypothetical protein H0V29_04925 [Thermoleophilaceae bacterium]|nr:hypothetical protein [Thermoleophilaceae bacterium]